MPVALVQVVALQAIFLYQFQMVVEPDFGAAGGTELLQQLFGPLFVPARLAEMDSPERVACHPFQGLGFGRHFFRPGEGYQGESMDFGSYLEWVHHSLINAGVCL